jgi:dTDP-4-dehydrorhamnose reductase
MEANNSDFKKTVLLPRLYSTPNSAKFVANGIFKAAQAILENRMPSKRIYHLTTIGSESRADFANFICKTLSITGTVFVSQEDHPSLQYRPARSNLIFSEELESIGIQRLHWIDDFCDYFMNDLYKMKRQQ